MINKRSFVIRRQKLFLVHFRKHPSCKVTVPTAIPGARLSSRLSDVSTIHPYAYSTPHQPGNHVHDYTELNVKLANQNHVYLELHGLHENSETQEVGYLEPMSSHENSYNQQDEYLEPLNVQQNSRDQEDEYLEPLSLSQQAVHNTGQ